MAGTSPGAGRVWIGTSGWSYDHWKTIFYPTGLRAEARLDYYARRFETVEINASFCRLPSREVFERWAAEVPDGFLFAVKASRFLTHLKRLRDPAEPLKRLLETSGGLREKRGPLLFQLPPNFPCDHGRLAGVLALLPREVPTAFATYSLLCYLTGT